MFIPYCVQVLYVVISLVFKSVQKCYSQYDVFRLVKFINFTLDLFIRCSSINFSKHLCSKNDYVLCIYVYKYLCSVNYLYKWMYKYVLCKNCFQENFIHALCKSILLKLLLYLLVYALCFLTIVLILSTLSNFNGLFHSLFWIKLKRSVGVKGLRTTSLVYWIEMAPVLLLRELQKCLFSTWVKIIHMLFI